MTVVKLSSKGQLVIPQSIRKALGLGPGTRLQVQVEGGRIVLEPVESRAALEALYGKYAGTDLLTDLEQEHQRELLDEKIRS
jgi:AbrB family looped-hinge helix DNA binding protein